MFTDKQVSQVVRNLMSTPEGKYFMDWLTELYQRYPFRHIVNGDRSNAALAMAYKAGQSDVVTFLQDVISNGLNEGGEHAGTGTDGDSDDDFGDDEP